jgi:hypothetical protein
MKPETTTNSEGRPSSKSWAKKSILVLSRWLSLDLQSLSTANHGLPYAKKQHGWSSSQITSTRIAIYWPTQSDGNLLIYPKPSQHRL